MMFERENNTVIININSRLGTKRPIYMLRLTLDNENFAELLKRQLSKAVEKTIEEKVSEAYAMRWKDAKAKRRYKENKKLPYHVWGEL